jgi:hypothetical protein
MDEHPPRTDQKRHSIEILDTKARAISLVNRLLDELYAFNQDITYDYIDADLLVTYVDSYKHPNILKEYSIIEI